MEKMICVSQTRHAGVRGGSALGLARSRRPRVERIASGVRDLTFARSPHPAQDRAKRLRGGGVSMES